MRNSTFLISIVSILAIAIVLMGCGTSKAVQGGAIGAAAGGVVGGVIGNAAGNTAVGAIIGAAVGGTAGALIGHHMDQQAEEMQRDLQNAKVERVGEGIKITFDSGILFDVSKSDLRPVAKTNLTNLSKVLNKYEDTNIFIEGDTDSTGTAEYNQKLSERRAEAVSGYLKGLNVQGSRITTVGLGESNPIASNSTVEGRQQNRRVEVAVFANDKLKDAAQKGELK